MKLQDLINLKGETVTSLLQGWYMIAHHHKGGRDTGNAAGTPLQWYHFVDNAVSLSSKDLFAVSAFHLWEFGWQNLVYCKWVHCLLCSWCVTNEFPGQKINASMLILMDIEHAILLRIACNFSEKLVFCLSFFKWEKNSHGNYIISNSTSPVKQHAVTYTSCFVSLGGWMMT